MQRPSTQSAKHDGYLQTNEVGVPVMWEQHNLATNNRNDVTINTQAR